MSNETVKIEYQFVGEDVGLTTKIDDIYKKLDKLGEGASVVIKKIDGLNTETITLTNTLNSATGKMEVFSSEMRELQAEADKATKEVNELINALNKLNSIKGNNGAITSQKQLNDITQAVLKNMEKVNAVQQKLQTSKLDFSGTPKFKQLEGQLNSVVKQLESANKLSNNLSNQSYRVSGTSISDIKNTKNNAKAIQAETKAINAKTKAIQANTQAQAINKVKNVERNYEGTITKNDTGYIRRLKWEGYHPSDFEQLRINARHLIGTDKVDSVSRLRYDLENFMTEEAILNTTSHKINNLKSQIDSNKFSGEKLNELKKQYNNELKYYDSIKEAVAETITSIDGAVKTYEELQEQLGKKDSLLNYPYSKKNADNFFKQYKKENPDDYKDYYKEWEKIKKNTQNIDKETKAIEANTQAQIKNRRITNTNIKQTPFKTNTGEFNKNRFEPSKISFMSSSNMIKEVSELAKTDKELNKLYKKYTQTKSKVDANNKTIKALNDEMNSYNPHDVNKSKIDSKRYNDLKKNIIPQTRASFEPDNKAFKEAETALNYRMKAMGLDKKYRDKIYGEQTRRPSNGKISDIKNETKAIEENTKAQNKNYQILGDISKLKGKALKTASTALKDISNNTTSTNSITSQLNNKAKELEQAINNNDTTNISKLSEEVKSLYSKQQALQKLQGVKLTNTANTGFKTTDVIRLNAEQKAQQTLNDTKAQTLKLEEQIADKNANTAKQTQKNIEAQMKADENRHQLVLANTKAYEDSKNRQYESGRKYAQDKRQDAFNFKQQMAYNKAVEQLPNEYKNLTNKYNSLTGKVKEETAKIDSVSNALTRKALKGYISSKDIEQAQSKLLNSQTKINKHNEEIEKLNQRANKVALIANTEARKVSGNTFSKQSKYYTNENGNSKTYRTTNGNSIKNTKSVLDNVKNYKALGENLNKAQSKLSSEMINLSASSMKLGSNLSGIQSGLGQFANAMRGIGNITTGLGKNISNLGKSMMNTGQNVQMLANSLRVLSNLAITGFKYAGQQGIEFDRSLQGVASTLNRIQINPDGTTSVMSDIEFDGIINNISNKAREQARTSIYDANQVMEAYRYTAMAGWNAEEMTSSMDTFINMATVARVEGDQFSTIVDLITDSLASLGMAYEGIDIDGDGIFDEKVRKDAEGLSESVQRLSDVMVKAQSISNLDLAQLSESYKKGASQLTLYGLELEEITALYSVLANRGIKGSQSATGLSSIMANLTAKTGQASKALDEITQKTGVDVKGFDSKGQYIGIDAHLGKLSKAFKKLKEMYGSEYGVDNLQLAQMLGGKHHFKSLAKILEGYDTGEYHEILALLKNSEGSTAEMAEITNQSTWAQLKMTLSEVKEAFLSLWDVIEPVFLDILEIIRKVAKAFTELSDEQKMNIAKWMAIVVVGTTLAGILSTVLIVIGSLVSMFGSLIAGFGKIISFIGTIIFLFSNWNSVMGLLVSVFPALGGFNLALGNVLKTLGLMVGKFALVASSVLIFINNIKLLTRAFKDAKAEGEGFLDVLGKTISNTGKQFENESLNIAEKIANMFNIDQDKIAKNLAKVFKMLINMFDNFITMITLGLNKKLSNLFNEKTGLGGFKDWIIGKLDYRIENGMEGKNLFESDLDRDAKSEGYDNYEDKLKSDRIKNTLNKITVLFDGEETGAFSNLIEKIENADGAEVELTIEDVRLDAIDYKSLKDSIKGSKTYIEELDGKIEKNIDNILKYNKQLDELKTKIKNTSNKNTKKNLQNQYNKIKEKRDAEIELKYSNEDEYRKKTAELVEKEDKLITIKTEYKNAGMEEELEYESIKEEFEQKHGSQLSFVNADEDIAKVEHLKKNIGDIKKELKKKLDSGMLSDEDYIKTYTALEKIDKFESGADKYDDLVRQQEIVKETAENKKLIQEQIDKQQKVMDDILEKNGLKKGQENKLEGTDKEAYNKANNLKESHQKDYDDESNKHNLAEKAIADMGDLQDVYDLWNLIYGNDKPLMKLFDEEELAILQQLGFGKQLGSENTPAMDLKENHKGIITDKSEAVSTVDTEDSRNNKNTTKQVQGPEPNFIRFNGKSNGLNENTKDKEGNNKTTQESNTNTQANTEITTANTDALNANTEAVNNNNKAKSETPSQPEQVETDTSGVDEFSQKVDTASQEAQTNLDNLVAKTTEMSDALGKINLSGITEAFTIVYVAIEEARNMLSNIAGFAVNTGVASFKAMGDALKTAIDGARTVLLGICGIASNRGISSLTSMGNSLDGGLQKARSSLLSICNVALNRGVNAMTTMGNALTSALAGASGTVSSIANQINSIKNTANSITIPGNASITPSIPSMNNNTSAVSALRTITNSSVNNSVANTSNFNISMDGIIGSSRKDIKTTARQLTTYCRRRGL